MGINMNQKTLIFVSIKGHTLDWYPVIAVHEHENCYRIIERNPDPEHWYQDFDFGDLVRCENHKFAENEFGLVAVDKCNHET